MSRSEENRTVKFDQLMEVRNTFLEKPYIKCRGDTIPRPFSKRSKLSIFLDEQSKLLYNLYLLYVKLSAMKIY